MGREESFDAPARTRLVDLSIDNRRLSFVSRFLSDSIQYELNTHTWNRLQGGQRRPSKGGRGGGGGCALGQRRRRYLAPDLG